MVKWRVFRFFLLYAQINLTQPNPPSSSSFLSFPLCPLFVLLLCGLLPLGWGLISLCLCLVRLCVGLCTKSMCCLLVIGNGHWKRMRGKGERIENSQTIELQPAACLQLPSSKRREISVPSGRMRVHNTSYHPFNKEKTTHKQMYMLCTAMGNKLF